MFSGGSLRVAVIAGLGENIFRNFHIVEWDGTGSGYLHLLVSLARKQHDVARSGLADRDSDGRPAVRFLHVFDTGTLQSDDSVIHDGERVFAARIIGSQDHEIAAPSGSFAHEGTLGAVAIATASEDGDHSRFLAGALDELAGQSGEIAQGIVGVA